MFGLIEMVAPPEDFISRLRSRFGKPELHAGELSGTRVLTARVPFFPGERRAPARRRMEKAARELAGRGIRWAVFPRDFSFYREFAGHGIGPVPVLPLYQRMAAELVFRIMEERGVKPERATVAVCGEHVSYPMREAALSLSRQVRYIAVAASYGGESLCRTLRRDLGVPVVFNPTGKQIAAADVLVLFSRPETLSRGGRGAILALYEGAEENAGTATGAFFRLPRELDIKVPPDSDANQLLAALMESGSVGPGDIQIESILWGTDGKKEKEDADTGGAAGEKSDGVQHSPQGT
ncbi:hypothetical protein [Papillibacter cinnamivorans]|uniref:Uncharacterized protein n=1 Tax=Papillibacter cinnamivorans DSM 12816 TaxID=1122930 RepID=A0A1W1ZES6_9FIRM|nr:hypothetical protein [Papillibacter cinnamivorans]SMC46846.1 hypothetical protein SAMN02745168_1010 [Papillibacter cinnamivorans DSM 12816]